MEHIPAGWGQKFILSAGNGINAGMLAPGACLTQTLLAPHSVQLCITFGTGLQLNESFAAHPDTIPLCIASRMAWGDKLLKFTGKPRADMYKDLTHSTIGFWTDVRPRPPLCM